MSETALVQIIASFASVVASLAAVFLGLKNAHKIQEVHVSINSRMDQLLKASGEVEHAAGVTQERNRNVSPDQLK